MEKHSLKHILHYKLNPEEGQKPSILIYILMGLILFSLVVFTLETEPVVTEQFGPIITAINLIIAVIFAIEYGVRVWSCGVDPDYTGFKGRLKFIISPMAVIDLIAFLPSFVLMGSTNAYWVRILRVFRLLRILKLGRYSKSIRVLGQVFKEGWREIVVSIGFALFFIFLSAVCLYFIEGPAQPEEFGSIPRTLWWSVATLTTVGYGDVYPITALGKVFASIIALLGIGVVALPTGILTSRFLEEQRLMSEKKLQERIQDE